MKYLYLTIKSLLNIIFFIVYVLLANTLINFAFGGILSVFDKSVPGPQDPIHVQILILVWIFVLLITVIWRKYFYFSLINEFQLLRTDNQSETENKEHQEKKEEQKNDREEKKEEKEQKNWELKKEYVKTHKEEKLSKVEVIDSNKYNQEELEIYIDKEIK